MYIVVVCTSITNTGASYFSGGNRPFITEFSFYFLIFNSSLLFLFIVNSSYVFFKYVVYNGALQASYNYLRERIH